MYNKHSTMSIDSIVNFLLSIKNFPASIAVVVLTVVTTILNYRFDKLNKENPSYKKPFYSYLFSVLYSILWVYINIYFEPNGVITFFRYLSLVFLLLVLILQLIIPNTLKKYM